MDDRGGATGLDRRAFLRLGLAAGPVSLAAACGWDGGGMLRPKLLAISRVNDWVGEHILHSNRRLAREYPVSARSRTMPAYHVGASLPRLADGAAWALDVGGAVRTPARLTLPMLRALPSVRYTVKHHCVEGWTTIASWTGVPFSTIAALVEPTSEARYVRFESFDVDRSGEAYSNGWDLESAMHPQTIVAHAYNDRPLMAEHGAPARLYAPVKLGYKMTKYLTRVTFTRERHEGYWERRGYPWLGGI
jgi:DMSO/TMAO reductase YedYZ molybdopterin-dependent catalytic subunit